MDLPNKNVMCHKTGFTKSCRELVVNEECNRWLQIQGTHPNTGEPLNKSMCIDDWVPMLLMENSQMQRQTGAAVESLRNVVHTDSQKISLAARSIAMERKTLP